MGHSGVLSHFGAALRNVRTMMFINNVVNIAATLLAIFKEKLFCITCRLCGTTMQDGSNFRPTYNWDTFNHTVL